MQEGDLILSIDEKKLKTMNDLREYIYTKLPGDVVTLSVLRGEQNLSIEITLGKK